MIVLFSDGIIPRDSKYITYLEMEIPLPLYATMTTLAGLGICLAISLFVFNVLYRNNRYMVTVPTIYILGYLTLLVISYHIL